MYRSRIALLTLAGLLLLFAGSVAPASSATCTVTETCLSCLDGYARPCTITQCGTQRTYSCGTCSRNCAI